MILHDFVNQICFLVLFELGVFKNKVTFMITIINTIITIVAVVVVKRLCRI